MKRIAFRRRLFALISVPVMMVHCETNNVPVSFDRLFPSSSFTTILATCAQVCSDIELLQQERDDDEKRDVLADALIGKMVRLDGAIDMLLKDYQAGKSVRLDDLDYLATVVDFMEITYNRITTESEAEIVAHFIARKIKKKLENMLFEGDQVLI